MDIVNAWGKIKKNFGAWYYVLNALTWGKPTKSSFFPHSEVIDGSQMSETRQNVRRESLFDSLLHNLRQ